MLCAKLFFLNNNYFTTNCLALSIKEQIEKELSLKSNLSTTSSKRIDNHCLSCRNLTNRKNSRIPKSQVQTINWYRGEFSQAAAASWVRSYLANMIMAQLAIRLSLLVKQKARPRANGRTQRSLARRTASLDKHRVGRLWQRKIQMPTLRRMPLPATRSAFQLSRPRLWCAKQSILRARRATPWRRDPKCW